MKKALIVAGFLFASISSAQAVQCVVQGYYRADGTYVKSYVREQTSCKTTQFAGKQSVGKMLLAAGAVYLVAKMLDSGSNRGFARGLDEGDIENVEMTPGAFDTQVLTPVQAPAPVTPPISQCPAGTFPFRFEGPQGPFIKCQ